MDEKSRNNKQKLLVLTTTFPRKFGDTEPAFVYELCRHLSDFDIHVIAPHALDCAAHENMGGVHVHRFRYAPEKFESLSYNGGIAANLKGAYWKYLLLPGFLLSQLLLAYRVAHRYQIHLLHAHWMIPTGLLGVVLCKLLPGNNYLLVTAHGGDVHQLKGNIFRNLRRWVARKADGVSVVSRGLEEKATEEKWASKNITIAPMGVDLQHTFTPKNRQQDRPTIVFAGRLVPKKGVSHLLEAMRLVADRLPNFQLLIAGDGPLLSTLKERTTALGLTQQVKFPGSYRLSDLPTILQQGHIAVLPYDIAKDGDAEGLGLTAIEAMGCGLPVIVGNVPAIHDVVQHEKNGLIVDPRNTQKLAELIIGLLQAPQRQKLYADNGRAYCLQHFDWDVCSRRYSELLKSISRTNKV